MCIRDSFNPSPNIQKYKWMFGFLAETLRGTHKDNTLHTIELAKRARDVYFTIADEENIEFDLLKKGILRFYDSQKEFKEDAEKKSWIEQPGMEWEVMSPDEVVALEPSLTTANSKNKIVGGVYTKSDASGDIHKFCINLEKVLVEKYDVRVLTDTSVSNLSQRGHKILVEYDDGQNLDSEEYANVVICAGVNTQDFANKLGDSMNVYPVKGYSVTIDLRNEQSKKGAPMVSLIDQPVKIVASRLGDKFRVAGTAELAGINTDIRQDRIRPLLRWVKEFFPEVRTESYTPWAGLRPMTPNMMPLTHESKMPGVFYHTGHGHLGWTLSAATAEIVAEKISSTD